MAIHISDDPLLTDKEAAAKLGVHVRTLRRWHDLGTGPAIIRVGCKRYYRQSAIWQWLLDKEGGQ